jgi:uncharacterized Ntn-hydrolase superfamily protein
MTWSIVARDADGAFGVAVASRFFAVGALCPHARRETGALSTQALVNPSYGPRALDLLVGGAAPARVVETLVAQDAGAAHRQVHLVDAHGRTAAYTGDACLPWCGHARHDAFSVAGNMLAGPQVLDDSAAAFRDHVDLPFALRLIVAMQAGECAGEDRRGKQAAALLVVTTEDYPALDLRVDDHPDPLVELRRLYEVSLERFQPFVACLPSRAQPAGITDRAEIERRIERFHAQRAARRAEER